MTKANVNQTLTVTGATYSTVTVNVYSYSAANLIVGSNPIQIGVTAQNGTTKTYNVIVDRLQSARHRAGGAAPAASPSTGDDRGTGN